MKYTIKNIQYNQLTESNSEENGNVFEEEVNETISYPLEENNANDNGNINENDSNDNDDENSYSSETVAATTTAADAPAINSFESKIDWNVISLSSIWIFLTLTFFGIFF